MSKYATLDGLIAEAIKTAPTLTGIMGHPGVRAELRRLDAITCRPDFRTIDARLQALRKAGKIRYDSKTGWSAAGPVAAHKDLADETARLTSQRDELLAALRAIMALPAHPMRQKAVEIAAAAAAKVEGGAA
jgi:hypothetical protein